MKTKLSCKFMSLALLAFSTFSSPLSAVHAQGTAFTYQGRLNSSGSPVNGSYDLTFKLFNTTTAGVAIAGPITNTATAVTNGLFTTVIDFGAGVFSGGTNWLEIAVRTNGTGGFNLLTPRQQLTPVPYAIYAENAATVVSAGITATQFNTTGSPANGQVLGYNGGSLVWENPATTASGWGLTGNSGTVPGTDFIGTTDGQALELHVSNARALTLQPDSFGDGAPSVVGGSAVNFAKSIVLGLARVPAGATIGGGGALNYSGVSYTNSVTSDFGTVGGGAGNTASSFATVSGGFLNAAEGSYSFAAGQQAQALHVGSFVWADDSQNAAFASTAPNQFLIHAAGNVGINTASPGSELTLVQANAGGRGAELSLVNNATATVGNEVAINFGTDSSTYSGDLGNAQIKARSMNIDNRTDIIMSTYNGSSFGERMRIQSGGNVGINTNSPKQALDVNGEFMVVDGLGGEQAYLGGDGIAGNGGLDVQIGSLNPNVSVVSCYNAAANSYMHLNVSSISILGGADLAEPFAMAADKIEAGSVVVIDRQHPGKLKLATQPYDKCVAGIVSGANGIHPGVFMQQTGINDGGQNVALNGRVYVLADASNGAIQPGDLLTTSSTPGHAMKVMDYSQSPGAIIGKAMSTLEAGRGYVLVLVTLQ